MPAKLGIVKYLVLGFLSETLSLTKNDELPL